MRVLACFLAALMGIQAVERLRLADGPHGCAGRLEVWHGGRWGTICDDGWDLRDAAVACWELGCGGALAAPGGAFFGEGVGPVWLSELACRGGEGRLGLCPHRGWKAHVCSHEEDAGVVCAGQRVADSRNMDGSPLLLDADLWPRLSGELSPSSDEPPVTQVPRPAGTPQSSPRKKSPRPPKQAKSTRSPLLTAVAHRQERLRLASGPHGCAGRLEVWHSGRWGTVCDDGWDLRDAAVACRELGCGGALAAPGGARFGTGSGPVWMDDVGCGGGEQALRDCPRSPWGRSNCDHSEDAGLVCTGPAPRLRLADGPHGCAGRLEVWHSGRWGSVCDDAWDLRDATVACQELGCGAALAAPGGAFFGEGSGPILLDDLRCRGNETALRFCPSRPWGQHDCHHREDAGAVCDGMPLGYVLPTGPTVGSNRPTFPGAASRALSPTVHPALRTAGVSSLPTSSPAPWEPGPEAGSPQLRLVAGPSRCSGRLEVWHAGRWGTVCDDSWDLRDSAVVCRELGCGRARPPDPSAGRFGWGAGPIWLDDVGCAGTEGSLFDCPATPWGKHNCAHNEDVGVTCTGMPGLDSISDPFSWSWIPSLGRNPDTWLSRELATKPSARLTPSIPEKTTKAPGKMPKSTKKWVTKHAKRLTTQASVMPTTKYSWDPVTQGSPELTSGTSPDLTAEPAHRPTSQTTSVPTPWPPWERASKMVTMPATHNPQEMKTSEATTEQIPPFPVEPSAEIPAEGSPESLEDLAPSPAGGTPWVSGPFRVRLADGPNRCAGRLEVWHAGRWGTVCDDNWDLRDGTVACWELGCGRVRSRVGKTHYGPGTGPIWLDDVRCKGTETSLSECPAGPRGQHNCDHEEDVGLTCTGHTDEEDYPPWTWDPTSGEDLAQETTAAGLPGQAVSWGSTRSPGTPSPAERHHPGPGREDGDEPSGTWGTPSVGALAKGTPTTGVPGPTLTAGTPKSLGYPSPAPRAHGDTGSGRKPWPEQRLPRPRASRTVSPAPFRGPAPTSPLAPQRIPDAASPLTEVTLHPPDTWPSSPASRENLDLTWTTPGLPLSTLDAATVAPALTPEPSPTPRPTLPKELTSDPSAPAAVTCSSSPSSGLTLESDTTAGWDVSRNPNTVPERSGSPDPATEPPPTTTPPFAMTSYSTKTPFPTPALYPTTASQPTATPGPITPPYPVRTPHTTTTPHTTKTPDSTTWTPDPTSTPAITTKSPLTSSEKESSFPAPAPAAKPSLRPRFTFMRAPSPSTYRRSSLESPLDSESNLSGTSPAPSMDTLSAEDLEPPGRHRIKITLPSPPQTPHSDSDPAGTPDLHLSHMAPLLDQPPPDNLTIGPMPAQNPGPLGPCVASPIRVMACEPPALVELLAAVRDVGSQLQKLTQTLEQDQRERQALGLGLAQLVEAAQGLGKLGEVVKKLAEAAWPPSLPAPTTTTPAEEEEERPLRGDV